MARLFVPAGAATAGLFYSSLLRDERDQAQRARDQEEVERRRAEAAHAEAEKARAGEARQRRLVDRLYYFSDVINAQEALRLGLVNDVFADDTFADEVRARARRLAEGPRIAYRYMQENFNRSVHDDLYECLDMEAAHHQRTGQTEDHREAARAFTEKRAPVFHNR